MEGAKRFVASYFIQALLLSTWLLSTSAGFAQGKWGYVDINGREIIAPKYLVANPFDHGYAKVYRSNDVSHTVFVNKAGEEFIVPAKKVGDPGLVTKYVCQGKVIEQNNFDEIVDIRGDFTLVRTPYEFMVADRRFPHEALRKINITGFGRNAENGNIWLAVLGRYYEFTGAIDKSDIAGFEIVSNPEIKNSDFEYIGEFCDGLAPALSKNGFWSYINKDMGQAISLPLNCCHASTFHEGLAAISIGGRKPPQSCDGRPAFGPFPGAKFGFIDEKGRVAIPVQYPCPPRSNDSHYGIFKDGYTLATANSNESIAYGYINRTGKFVIPPIYSSLGELHEGMAAFSSEKAGFDNSDAHISLNDKLLQFFKQFDYLGMDRQTLHSYLGKPTAEYSFPKSECFLLSNGCFGSTSLAVQFDAKDQACAYSIGSFGYWFEPPVTNELRPSVWITQPAKPELDENLYEFFNRVATTYYTAPYLVPKDTSALRKLNDAFTRPDSNQQTFSSETWQKEPSKRSSMIFALYHMNLEGKNPEQLQAILGKADRITENSEQKVMSQFYDLSFPGYDKVEIECQFSKSRLSGLGLLANSQSGLSTEKNCEWFLKNPTAYDVAREFNTYHSFVGCPLEYVCFVTGHPEVVPNSEEKLYRLGDRMQIKATGSKGYVTAFRIQNKSFNGGPKEKLSLSDWESDNHRPDVQTYSMGRVLTTDDNMENFIFNPFFSKFDKTKWKLEPEQRKYMLFSLAHECKLIGRERADIDSLLGDPNFIQSNNRRAIPSSKIKETNDSDPLTQNCIWYQLEITGEDTNYLQIAFKNDRVIAFRLAAVPNRKIDCFPKQLTFSHGF